MLPHLLGRFSICGLAWGSALGFPVGEDGSLLWGWPGGPGVGLAIPKAGLS